MKYFPMFIDTQGRKIVIVGGGEQAAQKYRLASKSEAEIIIAAENLDDELLGCAQKGLLTHHKGAITADLFKDSAMVFLATGCRAVDASLHDLAKAAGAYVNVVDTPELCDIVTPAIVDRDPVVVAIGTEGNAPVLARQIKTMIEQNLEPDLGEFVSFVGKLRGAVKKYMDGQQRRNFWRWVFSDEPRRLFQTGAKTHAMQLVKRKIGMDERIEDDNATKQSHVSIVGAGPGATDMITLRGIKRLQEADVIFYDRLVDPGILELARRDAERVYVGKTLNTVQWPQSRINNLIVTTAKQGKNIVRLKSGDPGMFSRGAEEVHALKDNDISYEIVPGVTAAAGAAAALGGFLTDRTENSTVVLTTGHVGSHNQNPDWARYLQSGTTLALYMGVQNAGLIRDQLLQAGLSTSTPVQIACSVGLKGEKTLETDLDNMCDDIQASEISNPAIIFVKRKFEAYQSLNLLPKAVAKAL